MAIRKLSSTRTKSNKFWDQSTVAPYIASAMDSIATYTLDSAVSTVTFSSITQNYSRLIVRMTSVGATGGSLIVANFNGDTAANYSWHELNAVGSGALAAYGAISQTYARIFGRNYGTSATVPTVSISVINNYTSSTKVKSIKSFSGSDRNGSGELSLTTSAWMPGTIAPITSLTIKTHDGTNMVAGSSIALYGVK